MTEGKCFFSELVNESGILYEHSTTQIVDATSYAKCKAS